jgi:hypothetical protein
MKVMKKALAEMDRHAFCKGEWMSVARPVDHSWAGRPTAAGSTEM